MPSEPQQILAITVVVDSLHCQLPFPGADHIQRETVAAGRRAAEILLAAMPGATGPEDRRIVGKVWPLELIALESDPGDNALDSTIS